MLKRIQYPVFPPLQITLFQDLETVLIFSSFSNVIASPPPTHLEPR